jgi:hypothetical protein
MRTLLGIFIVFWSIFFADSIIQAAPVGNTLAPYEQIQDWYAHGQAVTDHEVRGSYAGRCFSPQYPHTVFGSLLVIDSIDKPQDQGQGFPSLDPLKIYYEVDSGDPTVVDRLSADSVHATLVNDWESLPYVDQVNGTAGITGTSGTGYFWRVTVKKSNSYLVMLSESSADSVNYSAYQACYYFKPIK